MKIVLGISLLTILLSSCSQLSSQADRAIASENNCSGLIQQFLSSPATSVNKIAINTKADLLSQKVKFAYEEYVAKLYSESNDGQKKYFKKILSTIKKLPVSKSPRDAMADALLLKIHMKEDLIGTEYGIIRLVHELEHVKNMVGEGRLGERIGWMGNALFKRNSIELEETSAFVAEREFILSTHDHADLENIKEMQETLYVLGKLTYEEIKIRKKSMMQRFKIKNDIADDFRRSVSALKMEELEILELRINQLNAYYDGYKYLVESALTKSFDEYIQDSLYPYKGKIEFQNAFRILIPATVAMATATIILVETLDKKVNNSAFSH